FTEKRKDNQGRHRYQTLKSWLECRLSRQGLGLADLMLHAIALVGTGGDPSIIQRLCMQHRPGSPIKLKQQKA
ncbi:hypothetical protein, partial [Janthinobacterium sp. ROICE36]|uniref:hypothetical protein n=1 Tax=Janthinobacterium sp. ROICE36 TaxID=2048670 RepID=UPI0015E10C9F